MARKQKKQIFRYDCTITGETFKTTKKAPHPEELICVKAFYELNPEKDDRPEAIKKHHSLAEDAYSSPLDDEESEE